MRKISHINPLVQRLREVPLLHALVLSTCGTSAGIEGVHGSDSLSELLPLGTSQMSWQDQT